MILKFLFLGLGCFLMVISSCSDKNPPFRFTLEEKEGTLISQPVSIDLNRVKEAGVNIGEPLTLVMEASGEIVPIDFQVSTNGNTLSFVRTSEENRTDSRVYRIENGVPPRKTDTYLSEHRENGSLQLTLGQIPVLSYRYEMNYPPDGVDSIYKKSGYIHPVLSPQGDTLSRIQPPDHYHHYGIWGPWTHTRIDGQQVDFWNLGDGKGTVLFQKFINTESGDVFASFNAAQEHIDLLTQDEPQTALNEDLEVILWDLKRDDRYMFDYNSSFSSPLEEGILFEAYRYGGGIGMRFTERWKANNVSVLTSEGNDRATADGTNARWCIVEGESAEGDGKSGILFMSHPQNRAHPEPMRVWPLDANGGRGDLFFEFCPIRHKEWQIEPDKEYELKYRMVVFDGELSANEAEAYWQAFSHPPKIEAVLN